MPVNRITKRYWDAVQNSGVNSNTLEINHFPALVESVQNIFRVGYGDAGGIFRPDWGNLLEPWLHEPISDHVADVIQIMIVEDMRRNHAVLSVDIGSTLVTPLNTNPPGYHVRVGIREDDYQNLGSLEFNIFP